MSTETDAWRDPSAWSGWVVFAGIVLFTIGCINIIQGLAALLKDEVYINGENGLLVTTNFDAWGWSLIFWGAVMILVGIGLSGHLPSLFQLTFESPKPVRSANNRLQPGMFPAECP